MSQMTEMEVQLSKTVFAVEATTFEVMCLRNEGRAHWEQISPGYSVTVGYLAGMPCVISISWNRVDGHLVMFWDNCSLVSDTRLTEAWFEKNCNAKQCNAMNFHLCIQFLRAMAVFGVSPTADDESAVKSVVSKP